MSDQAILEAQLVILAATLERLVAAADQQNEPRLRDQPHFPTPSQEMSQGWLGATWVHYQAMHALNVAKVPKLRDDAEARAKRSIKDAELDRERDLARSEVGHDPAPELSDRELAAEESARTIEERGGLSVAEVQRRQKRSAEAPFDGPRPTVAECIEAGGHFWPEGRRARSVPCTRCGWDPGWIGEGTPPERREFVKHVAQKFHEAYERHAPLAGYETRPECKVPWNELPAPNRSLMLATIYALLDEGVIR